MNSTTDEKAQVVHVHQAAPSSSSSSDQSLPTSFSEAANGKTDVDAAWKFLNDHRGTAGVSAVDINALRRKIDWHIVPLMFCCYTMQFLDKVILNVRTGVSQGLNGRARAHSRARSSATSPRTILPADNILLQYAAVMGISKDLNLQPNEFSNIATFLFVGLICFEVPNGEETPSY